MHRLQVRRTPHLPVRLRAMHLLLLKAMHLLLLKAMHLLQRSPLILPVTRTTSFLCHLRFKLAAPGSNRARVTTTPSQTTTRLHTLHLLSRSPIPDLKDMAAHQILTTPASNRHRLTLAGRKALPTTSPCTAPHPKSRKKTRVHMSLSDHERLSSMSPSNSPTTTCRLSQSVILSRTDTSLLHERGVQPDEERMYAGDPSMLHQLGCRRHETDYFSSWAGFEYSVEWRSLIPCA
jgi:hypothetical protein